MMNPASINSMYFIAILCPPEINEKVLQFKYWMKEQYGCTVALKSPAHITLIAPFWMDEIKEAELMKSLQSFKVDDAGLQISLHGFWHFGKRVLFINVNDNPVLQDFKNRVEDHFIYLFNDVIKKEDRPFHPHITIANRDLKPKDFELAWADFSNMDFKEAFLVKTISLLRLRNKEFNWQVIQSNTS